MQSDPMAALRRPWFLITSELLVDGGAKHINTEWFVPVYHDFDSDYWLYALRPLFPLLWLVRFWDMNRLLLERLLAHRLLDLPEGGYYRDATFRPPRRWSWFRTEDRTGRRFRYHWPQSLIIWP